VGTSRGHGRGPGEPRPLGPQPVVEALDQRP
jgi:hypothetical protein